MMELKIILCCNQSIDVSKGLVIANLFHHGNQKRLCGESIKTPAISNNSLSPALIYINAKIRIKFCLKQDKFTFHHETVVIIYIVHKINFWPF